jgi:hypothetical protein
MMPAKILITWVIVLVVLVTYSLYEQYLELTPKENGRCLEPYPAGSNRFPTWAGTPHFSPRCYQAPNLG